MKKLRAGQKVKFWDVWEMKWCTGKMEFMDEFDAIIGWRRVRPKFICELTSERAVITEALKNMAEKIEQASELIDRAEADICQITDSMIELHASLNKKPKKRGRK